MKYEKYYTVRWHETNARREMTPSAILALMQETANFHLASLAGDLDTLRDRDRRAFILSKIVLRFYAPLHTLDELRVETFTGEESRGCSYLRSFRVFRGEEIVAEANSLWVLLDLSTERFVPVDACGIPFSDEPSVDLPLPRRIVFDGEPSDIGTRTIVYSDIDYNRHMNNTHYPNMLCDFLPSPERLRVTGMTLSFLRGALYGQTLSIARAERDGNYFFRTRDGEGNVCLEAEISTTEMEKGDIV